MTRSRAPHAAPRARLSASQAPARPTTRPDPGTALTEPLSASVAMTPEQAAWVREHAWTAEMRANNPAWRAECLCQRSKPCRHDRCRADSGPLHETAICDRTGVRLLADAEHTRVWLADRTCRWRCRCRCHIPARRPASAMTEAEAAEIRERAWTRHLRKQFADSPGYVLRCACQRGRSSWCASGLCDGCRPPDPAASVSWETLICDRSGLSPVFFAEPFEHPTPSLTGPHCERMAMVWLADRGCRWACECRCHRQAAPEPEPARVGRGAGTTYELVPLFDLTEVGA